MARLKIRSSREERRGLGRRLTIYLMSTMATEPPGSSGWHHPERPSGTVGPSGIEPLHRHEGSRTIQVVTDRYR